MSALRGVLIAVVLLGSGCSGNAGHPLSPAAPKSHGSQVTRIDLHGVLYVPSPSTPGIQGRQTPWITADDGTTFELLVKPGLEDLTNPSFSGRGITVSGHSFASYPVPVGAEPNVLDVDTYSFD